MGSFIKACQQRVGEMEDTANSQDGGDKILLCKLSRLHIYYILPPISRGKYIIVCKQYTLLFMLIIHILYSFTHTFSTLYVGLLLTRTVVASVNL